MVLSVCVGFFLYSLSLSALCLFSARLACARRIRRERERERERGRKRIVFFFVSSLKEKSNGFFEVREQSRNFAAETLHLFPNKKKKNKSSSSSLFFAFCVVHGSLEL